MSAPSNSAAAIPGKVDATLAPPLAAPKSMALAPVLESLGQLADDASVPRNIRRGAQAARDELGKPRVPLDVRVASAVYVLDDLANDPNLPTHGRTAIWSIISALESLQ
ncbi:MAG TPA: UPF0147 family protein [Thermoplasmata archaeon]|nr:UPF0147 family protein [Thermoplasmata archaeon]